jgi:hypothetical protein
MHLLSTLPYVLSSCSDGKIGVQCTICGEMNFRLWRLAELSGKHGTTRSLKVGFSLLDFCVMFRPMIRPSDVLTRSRFSPSLLGRVSYLPGRALGVLYWLWLLSDWHISETMSCITQVILRNKSTLCTYRSPARKWGATWKKTVAAPV